MGSVTRTFVTIIGIGAFLALSYQLLTHPSAAVGEFKAFGGVSNDLFKTAEGR